MNPTGAQIASVSDTRSETARSTGCPEWDNGGIRAALLQTDGPVGDVMAAAHIAAGDPGLQYPSRAAFVQRWSSKASAPARARNAVPCPTHPDHDEPCQHPAHRGDMTPEDVRAAKERCLAIAAEARAAAEAERAERETRRQEATR